MGAGNVKAVYGRWGHLPDRPFRLLVFMAVTAKDDGDPPLYWGGRETLAVGLGREIPDKPTQDDASPESERARRTRHAAFESVRATVEQLVKAGAIRRTRKAFPGKTAEYALTLLPRMEQAHPVPNGAGPACATTQAQPAQRHRPSLRMEQAHPVPEDYQDDIGLTEGPPTHPSAQPQGDARGRCSCGHNRFAADGECLNCRAPGAA
jgi:hypothetical protein